MGCWRSFGSRMLSCNRSMLKTRWNCSNAAGFHHSTCGVGGALPCPVRSSSEYFVPVGVLKTGASFSSIHRCFSSLSLSAVEATAAAAEDVDVGVADEEEALRGPLPLRSAPCLMLPAGSGLVAEGGERYKLVKMEDERNYYQFFSFREKKVVKMRKNVRLILPWQREVLPPDEAIYFGSSRGWLVFIHPHNCSLYLFNPFIHSYLPYLPLPPIQTLPCIMSCLRYNSSTHGHTSASSSSSSSSSSYSSSIDNTNNVVTEFNIWRKYKPISSRNLSEAPFFQKIVLSSSPPPFPSHHHLHHEDIINRNANHINESNSSLDSDCTVMAIQGYQEYKLAFCKIGDTAWTALKGEGVSYDDVIYFSKDQKFYALHHEFVEAWDLRNPASPKNTLSISHWPPLLHPTIRDHYWLRQALHPDRYLVESSGELLMVVRYYNHNVDDDGNYQPKIITQDSSRPKKTIIFDVYKLDFVNMDWLLLPSLGPDRALFIGLNDSISVSPVDFPGLAMNCIYFTCPNAELLEDTHDLGVFNFEDNSITPIYHYDLDIQLPSLWIVPAAQQ